MAPKDIRDKILELLRYSWYNPVSDAWTHPPPPEGYKWVPKVIYLTTLMANKDAIVINDINDVNIILGLLSKHIVYCTPDVKAKYNIPCNVVDKIPDDVFVIALPP
jgi:hypothetical protein